MAGTEVHRVRSGRSVTDTPCQLFVPRGLTNHLFQASEWRRAESGHRRGPKTVLTQTTEVMSFLLFSFDFKPKVLVAMLFLW